MLANVFLSLTPLQRQDIMNMIPFFVFFLAVIIACWYYLIRAYSKWYSAGKYIGWALALTHIGWHFHLFIDTCMRYKEGGAGSDWGAYELAVPILNLLILLGGILLLLVLAIVKSIKL
ncbi:hypothetical protein BKI52_08260 [marine bacterium AO1-C]|nr:hypothetical protein BKI52_08260 [marine bacterium AO1-C]